MALLQPLAPRPMYPDAEDLAEIRDWPNPDWRGLLTFVRALWEYAEHGGYSCRGSTYRLSTAGWSGNEEIVEAMGENAEFWRDCFVSQERGGHYTFRVPTR